MVKSDTIIIISIGFFNNVQYKSVIDSIEPYSHWQTKLQIFLLRFSDPIFVKLAKNLKRVGADKIVQNADLLVQVKEDMIFDPFQGRKVVN